jgi:hypothetical protein
LKKEGRNSGNHFGLLKKRFTPLEKVSNRVFALKGLRPRGPPAQAPPQLPARRVLQLGERGFCPGGRASGPEGAAGLSNGVKTLMPFINFSKDEIQCKIVYYGAGFCGKTTNIQYIYTQTKEDIKGKMVSIDTKGDRTLFFDFLSLSLGKIRGFDIRVQLYTVPGQVHYDATRKLVIKGVDGVVFVADSLKVQRKKNIESLINLAKNLAERGVSIRSIPLVIQYNKRDLDGTDSEILPMDILEKDLNSMLKVPSFPGSALKGNGVFETLREISKLVVKDVSRKVMLLDKQLR